MKNQWFEEKFIPSFFDKMKNPKYPNRAILSERQYDVATKYMTCDKYCWNYRTDMFDVCVYDQGRYHFISVYRKAYKIPYKIRWRRQDRNEALYGREYC
jgi:hypothetical protein